MVVRRKYSLPECTLIVEGIGDPQGADERSTRPLLSVLVSAECHLVGKPHALTGDRAFLEAFAETVDRYARGMMSGLSVSSPPDSPVTVEPVSANDRANASLHRLSVRQPDAAEPLRLDLTTLQLFDLVEALDQMLADRRTLPDWAIEFQPRTRREAHNEEPIQKRAAPFALGASGLVIAALALFSLPVPKVEPPSEPLPDASEDTSELTTTPNGDPPTATPPDTAENAAENTSAAVPELDEALETVPEITDPDRLLALRYNLYQDLDRNWTTEPTFDRDLVYRVTVGIDGAILGYRPENSPARDYADETPLQELVYVPVEGGTAQAESLAEFKVVFTENGVLQVSPWDGYPSTPNDPPTIDDIATLENLLFEVRDDLYDEWTTEPRFDRDLEYRLAVTEDGAIARYEPLSSAASLYFPELPIEPLYDPASSIVLKDGKVNLAPLAEFRVVFTPRGTLEISPWDGY